MRQLYSGWHTTTADDFDHTMLLSLTRDGDRYIVSALLPGGTHGEGATPAEALADYAEMLGQHRSYLIQNSDRLAPRLTEELRRLLRFWPEPGNEHYTNEEERSD